jgi:hypothetical protein
MRSVAERGARAVAFIALVLAVWTLSRGAPIETDVHRAKRDWTTQSVRLTFDSAPSPVDRDWLAALRRNGVAVTWNWRRQPPPALAVAARPLADPAGATRVAVAAPGGTRVTLSDRLGPIDTASAASGGLTAVVPVALHTIAASGASATVADSLALRPLLVLGTVGWETKFVVRALEERGWIVDARLALSPTRAVAQGKALALDTAHYAVVLALDSGARSASAAIARYAHQGGGVIIAGSAGHVLGAIAPAQLGVWRDAKPLSYFRLDGPDSLMVVSGNIAQVGYDDTWRLRMDSAHGPSAHRTWWANLVAAVAYAPELRTGAPVGDDPAPVAATVDRLGSPAAAGGGGVPFPGPRVWFAVIAAALLFEWGSRRLRGAP